ncbi:hypothetical protein Tco_0199524 [Tanacetum coccineum]
MKSRITPNPRRQPPEQSQKGGMEIGAPEARHQLPVSSKDSNKTDLLHLGPGRGRRVVCSTGWEENNKVHLHVLTAAIRVPTKRKPMCNQRSIIIGARRPGKLADIRRVKTVREVTGSPNQKDTEKWDSRTIFVNFQVDRVHSTDECMQLRKQIDEMIMLGKLSQFSKELKQSEAKGTKEWGNGRKRQAPSHLDDSTMGEGEEDGTEGPMIIKAKIGGHYVHRIYVDEGAVSGVYTNIGYHKALAEARFPTSKVGDESFPLLHDDCMVIEKGCKELCALLKQKPGIVFAWKPADMTGIPRHMVENAKRSEGCPPV